MKDVKEFWRDYALEYLQRNRLRVHSWEIELLADLLYKASPTGKTNQRTEIILYLTNYGQITRAEAFEDLGIAELPARICELKQNGIEFIEETIPFVSRLGKHSSYVKYRLKG